MTVSRRTLLWSALGSGALSVLYAVAAPVAGAARRLPAPRRNPAVLGTVSPNGWPVVSAADAGAGVWARPVPGTGAEVELLVGDVEVILVHVIRRFHYEVQELLPGDLVGFRPPAGLRGTDLNHATGTAVDIRPGSYPAGQRGGFYPHQEQAIRDILAECGGVVAWGGDSRAPNEAHFEIALPRGDKGVATLARRLRGWNEDPGAGAGVTGLGGAVRRPVRSTIG